MKLLNKDIKAFRDKMLEEQGGRCTLCERVIPEGKAVLDHNHKTGYVRSVLCNCCNRCESITKTFRRYGMPEECLPVFLENLLEYWKQDFSENRRTTKRN